MCRRRRLQSEALRVPETMKLDALLGELRGRGYQMAVVVDEYGGTAGVVDARGPRRGARRRGRRRARPHAAPASCARGDSVTFPGILRPDELLERTGIRVPEDGDYETVGGFVMSRARPHPASSATRSSIEDGTLARASASTAAASTGVRFTPDARARDGDDAEGGEHDERLGGHRLAGRAAASSTPSSSARSSPSSRRAARRSSRSPSRARRSAKTALWAMEHATLMLATSQLGITICSLLILNVSEPAIHHLLEVPLQPHRAGRRRSSATVAFVIALRARVVPARGVRRDGAEEPLVLGARPRRADARAAARVRRARLPPVIVALNATANGVLRLFRVEPKNEAAIDLHARRGRRRSSTSRASEGVLDDATRHARRRRSSSPTKKVPDSRCRCRPRQPAARRRRPAEVERAVAQHGSRAT